MKTKQVIKSLCFFAFVVAASSAVAAESAAVQWDAASGRLTLEYHGGAILRATVTARDADGQAVTVKLEKKGAIERSRPVGDY